MQSPLGGIGRSVNNAARGAFGGVEKLIATVEGLATGIASIEREMKGMRRDMREVIDQVQGLREDLGGFDDIRSATTSMDREVQEMRTSLEGVNHLLDRYPRLLGRTAAEKRARRDETEGT